MQEPNWIDHAMGWGATLFAGVALLAGRSYMRLFDHERRLKILEDQHLQKLKALDRINEKIDAIPTEMTRHLDTRVAEVQVVLQTILRTCLDKGCQ